MNTLSVPPAGGSPALAGASVGGPQKDFVQKGRPALSAAEKENLAAFMENQAQIAALHAENVRLLRECPGLFCPEIMSKEHRATLAVDFDFRVDRMSLDILREFMARMPVGETVPASLTKEESQLIVGYRFISHGCYGEVFAQTSEKRRVKIGVTINGR